MKKEAVDHDDLERGTVGVGGAAWSCARPGILELDFRFCGDNFSAWSPTRCFEWTQPRTMLELPAIDGDCHNYKARARRWAMEL